MTPNYVAVKEHWTIQQALDYIRLHGQNSETLNVIYVVDDQGLLVDDIGIRELLDRKSTRLNSSHVSISYAVFCLKKKKREYTARCHDRTGLHQSRSAAARSDFRVEYRIDQGGRTIRPRERSEA